MFWQQSASLMTRFWCWRGCTENPATQWQACFLLQSFFDFPFVSDARVGFASFFSEYSECGCFLFPVLCENEITHVSDSPCCFALFSYLHRFTYLQVYGFKSVFYSKSRLNCSWFPNFEPSFLKIGIDGYIEIIALEKMSHSQVSHCSAPVILLFKAEVYWCESLILVLP